MRRTAARPIGALLLTIALFLVTPFPAPAQSLDDGLGGCSGSWLREFGVDVLILDCAPGFATDHDRAYMYARGAVDTGADWRTQLNFSDAVWLFDAGARGKASLIIDFRRTARGLVAELFDDVRGEDGVRYGLERGIPRSVQTRFPTVRITAPDGWWVRDGAVNYNLRIDVDGPVRAMRGSELYADLLLNDGQSDYSIDVRDASGRGRPTWQIAQAWLPFDDTAGVPRTALAVSPGDDEPLVRPYIIWPHLGSGAVDEPAAEAEVGSEQSSTTALPSRAFGAGLPPIQVDWRRSRIAALGELVETRARAAAWSIASIARFAQAGSDTANFENPLATYDLAGAADGAPDLVIRGLFYRANDTFAPAAVLLPNHDISFTWDAEHRRSWSYKVGVYGRRPMPSTIRLDGATSVQSVRYDEYPAWVVENSWEAATFVAAEDGARTEPTGISEWCAGCSPEVVSYVTGQSRSKPVQSYSDIPIGLRGEFRFDVREPPRLYISPLDGKLHLYKAEGGVWRRNASDKVTYRAIDSPFVNRWERSIDGVTAQSLALVANRLVYADSSGIRIADVAGGPEPTVLKPPTDRAEWLHLREQLSRRPPGGEPYDLEALFNRVGGQTTVIPGAALWGLRPQGGGFRFVAQLADPVPNVDWLADKSPGTYVVAYQPDVGFVAQPARPSELAISAVQVKGDQPGELVASRLAVELRNDGDQDIPSVPVLFFAGRGGADQLVAWTTADVPAGATTVADALWTPASGGDWWVQAAALDRLGTTGAPASLSVAPAASADVAAVLAAQGLHPFSVGAIGASLTLIAAAAMGLSAVIWPPEQRNS